MTDYFKDVINRLENIEELTKQNISLNKEVLNLEEACIFLGINKNHLYKLTSGGHISYSKPGGKKLFFTKKHLFDWVQSNQFYAQTDIDQEAVNQILNSKVSIN